MDKQANHQRFQVAVLGSGLPGSVMALVLAKIGFDVVVLEKGSHPRFAIGESSTPTADLYLAQIADEFSIPELKPLSRYRLAKQLLPQLNVGPKRGFSYFRHQVDQKFTPGENHENELLVAASASDEFADSNWLRQDIDEYAVSIFSQYSIEYVDHCQICEIENDGRGWNITTERKGQRSHIGVDFFVDATGKSAVGIKSQNGAWQTQSLHTNTRAIYAHFENLKPWSSFFDEVQSADHPYPCDHAAVHQVLDGAWMWQLPFDSGLTSCGIVWPNSSQTQVNSTDTDNLKRFKTIVNQYPTLQKQFEDAVAATPKGDAFKAERLQHFYDIGAGKNWCALPNTIGFIDPLHSKGMAHALSGVYRIGKRFAETSSLSSVPFTEEVQLLSDQFSQEVMFLDRLISICYLTLESFNNFRLSAYWYFAAATCFEREASTKCDLNSRFLFSGNEMFCERLFQHESKIRKEVSSGRTIDTTKLEQETRRLLEPFDHVGIFSPQINNMYARTTAPFKST